MEGKMRRRIAKTAAMAKRMDNIVVHGKEYCGNDCNFILVGNGGLENGVSYEQIYDIYSRYGTISRILSHPKRPYCLLKFEKCTSALNAQRQTNGTSYELNGRNIRFYVSCVKSEGLVSQWEINSEPAKDLFYMDDFIDGDEENKLVEMTRTKLYCLEYESLQNRKVIHFGYRFNYSENKPDTENPIEPIPDLCFQLMRRAVQLKYISELPDQLTVNCYEPGIQAHIDAIDQFGPEIICLSLLSSVAMRFKSGEHEFEVDLKPRSLLVMKGRSRYDYTHRISPRKIDFIVGKDGQSGSVRERQTRISFTFRKTLCEHLSFIERKHVVDTYEQIANSFSKTRRKPWPIVKQFIESIEFGSLVLEAGCGNGKNMLAASNRIHMAGVDICSSFCKMVVDSGCPNVCLADCTQIPFRTGIFDAVLSIAVIHHLSSRKRRINAIREIVRTLRHGGKALISVWAFEQECFSHKTSSSDEISTVNLPLHKNRTQFNHQDVLVPWKSDGHFLHRFYHVFKAGELRNLLEDERHIHIQQEETYDKGNWYIIIEKSDSYANE